MPLVREECIEMAGVHVGVIILSIEDLQKSQCLGFTFQNGSSVITLDDRTTFNTKSSLPRTHHSIFTSSARPHFLEHAAASSHLLHALTFPNAPQRLHIFRTPALSRTHRSIFTSSARPPHALTFPNSPRHLHIFRTQRCLPGKQRLENSQSSLSPSI